MAQNILTDLAFLELISIYRFKNRRKIVRQLLPVLSTQNGLDVANA